MTVSKLLIVLISMSCIIACNDNSREQGIMPQDSEMLQRIENEDDARQMIDMYRELSSSNEFIVTDFMELDLSRAMATLRKCASAGDVRIYPAVYNETYGRAYYDSTTHQVSDVTNHPTIILATSDPDNPGRMIYFLPTQICPPPRSNCRSTIGNDTTAVSKKTDSAEKKLSADSLKK